MHSEKRYENNLLMIAVRSCSRRPHASTALRPTEKSTGTKPDPLPLFSSRSPRISGGDPLMFLPITVASESRV